MILCINVFIEFIPTKNVNCNLKGLITNRDVATGGCGGCNISRLSELEKIQAKLGHCIVQIK